MTTSYAAAVIVLTSQLSERLEKGPFYTLIVTSFIYLLAIVVFVVLIDGADLRRLLVAMSWETWALSLGLVCFFQVQAINEVRRLYLVRDRSRAMILLLSGVPFFLTRFLF